MSMPDAELIAAARTADPDRTLCVMLMPAAQRRTALALLLFNQELARIPELAQEPMAGLLRMRWWQDAVLGQVVAGTPGFAGPIRAAIEEGEIWATDVESLVDARAMALDDGSKIGIDGLVDFAARTSGHVQMMLARLLTDEPAWHDQAAGAGEMYGLVGLVRAIGHQATHGRGSVPSGAIRDAGLRDAMVRKPADDLRLRQACEPLLAEAAARFNSLKQLERPPRRLMPVLLISQIARQQLRQIARHPGSIVAAADISSPPWTPLSVLARYILRQI